MLDDVDVADAFDEGNRNGRRELRGMLPIVGDSSVDELYFFEKGLVIWRLAIERSFSDSRRQADEISCLIQHFRERKLIMDRGNLRRGWP